MADTSLKKHSLIQRNRLNEKHYVESLINAGLSEGLLTAEEADEIYIGCLVLLGKRAEKFVNKKSSSVAEETAEKLLRGALFLMGMRLKNADTPEKALNELKTGNYEAFIENSLDHIHLRLQSLKSAYKQLCGVIPDIPCTVYNDTLKEGLRAFFLNYNPEYFADDPIISGDYPTCQSLERFTGFEFIERYIIYNYYETSFLSRFDSGRIDALLSYAEPGYTELILNLFEPVLCAAVACVLTGNNPLDLCLFEHGRLRIVSLCQTKTESELHHALYTAARKLFELLEITGDNIQIYILECLPHVRRRFFSAVRQDGAAHLALLTTDDVKPAAASFDYGVRTNGKRYRAILAQLHSAESPEKKAAVIKSRVHSLSDFEDLLIDGDFDNADYPALFGLLLVPELSALLVHHPAENAFLDEISEAEKRLRSNLFEYISSLPAEIKTSIIAGAKALDDYSQSTYTG